MPRLHLLRLPSKLKRRARRSRLVTMFLLIIIVCTLVAPFYIIYKPPSFLIRYFQHRWPDVLWRVSTSEKLIALTIDDGPSDHTDEIREILRENQAKATFFVIGGQVTGRQDILKNLVKDGHELGNHAMHDEPSRSLANTELVNQIQIVEKMVHDAYEAAGTSKPPKYFRPGSGFFSDGMRKTVREMGYRLVLGSIYPHDPQIPYWWINARHILSMLKPGGIIICHDRRSWTAPMLRKVLPEIRRRGYRVVTLTELLKAAKKENT
jgi:peptidoglycan/xylan/chitin deacetylase (PgdA/CDA1 family)